MAYITDKSGNTVNVSDFEPVTFLQSNKQVSIMQNELIRFDRFLTRIGAGYSQMNKFLLLNPTDLMSINFTDKVNI